MGWELASALLSPFGVALAAALVASVYRLAVGPHRPWWLAGGFLCLFAALFLGHLAGRLGDMAETDTRAGVQATLYAAGQWALALGGGAMLWVAVLGREV